MIKKTDVFEATDAKGKRYTIVEYTKYVYEKPTFGDPGGEWIELPGKIYKTPEKDIVNPVKGKETEFDVFDPFTRTFIRVTREP